MVVFNFEPKPASEYSPLFLNAPTRRTAAVNAGDYRLYLGGYTINGAFRDLLQKHQDIEFDFRCQRYADLHRDLLAASREAGGELVAADGVREAAQLQETLCLSASFGQAGEAVLNDTIEAATGAVFLDVFTESRRPYSAEGNAAMLYVVGPKGEHCRGPKSIDAGPLLPKEQFTLSIEALGKRALEAVAVYNRQWAKESPIEEVRWCLVSGDAYRHAWVSKIDVAFATLCGMSAAQAVDGLVVTFTYDEGEEEHKYDEGVFQKARDCQLFCSSVELREERRIDRDGEVYTFEEVKLFYESTYDILAIIEYWKEMLLVGSPGARMA